MSYAEFFEQVTGHAPYPYQAALAEGPWPKLLDVPTGLGKTAAVIVAWAWRRLRGDEHTGRRLVYCLPMRTLVEQTHENAKRFCERATRFFDARELVAPSAHKLMGGSVDISWDTRPEQPAILIGTQDMLLSRALNRGYAMSRYRWPVHFGLLNSDCLWVFDETQLMGVGVETGAQLQGLREALGTPGRAHSLWMSATLGREQLRTVDHPEPPERWPALTLGPADQDHARVARRTGARKAAEKLAEAGCTLDKDTRKKRYAAGVADMVARTHEARGDLTLVIVNRVQRAQDIYSALRRRGLEQVALIHSRFRPADRERNELVLLAPADGVENADAGGSRVVVATQAIEAGVDVSARTMFTELAPWPSLVQRLGRCNRHGEYADARVYWMDIEASDKDDLALPYEAGELAEARGLLERLARETGGDAGPAALRAMAYQARPVLRPVLRRRDLLDLFDTTPDLCGNDVDVSIYVRDADDVDCQIFWRDLGEQRPDKDTPAPRPEELCRVSVKATAEFLEKLRKKRGEATGEKKKRLGAWTWDALANEWVDADRPRPGQIILVHAHAGGYDPALGWRGVEALGQRVAEVPAAGTDAAGMEAMGGDPATAIGRWVSLRAHLGHVHDEAASLGRALGLADEHVEQLATAGLWHDVGKAHRVFQDKLLAPVREQDAARCAALEAAGPWAKSDHNKTTSNERPYFRHELASALAYLKVRDRGDDASALVAYLIAAHHGKVRLSIRSLPDEQRPPEPTTLYARGVWQGDEIPALMGADEVLVPEAIELDLSCMQLGPGSWLERMLALRDDAALGPFRLAVLELVVRIADWRASDKEQRGGYDE